jgi:threonine/homoserine/homoserine lactone efflux protein
MAVAIGDILTPAMGVALSPFPVVAVILMLLSEQGRNKGLGFMLGWIAGLTAMVGVVLVLAELVGIEEDRSAPSTLALVVKLALGLGLVYLAVRKWWTRPKAGEPEPMPGWMSSVEQASPGKALMYGAMLSGLNPKNLLFNIVAGTAIASAGASVSGEIVAWVVYILLASLSVIVPVVWYVVSPATASARLEEPRRWLIRNSSVMVALILLFVGVSQIGDAISGFGA